MVTKHGPAPGQWIGGWRGGGSQRRTDGRIPIGGQARATGTGCSRPTGYDTLPCRPAGLHGAVANGGCWGCCSGPGWAVASVGGGLSGRGGAGQTVGGRQGVGTARWLRYMLRYMLGPGPRRLQLPESGSRHAPSRHSLRVLAEKVLLRNGEGLPDAQDPLQLAYWLCSNVPFRYPETSDGTDGLDSVRSPILPARLWLTVAYFGRVPMAEPCTRDPAGTSSGGRCWSATPMSSASACCRPSWRMWMDRVGLRPGP
jgi:hypothetical protein